MEPQLKEALGFGKLGGVQHFFKVGDQKSDAIHRVMESERNGSATCLPGGAHHLAVNMHIPIKKYRHAGLEHLYALHYTDVELNKLFSKKMTWKPQIQAYFEGELIVFWCFFLGMHIHLKTITLHHLRRMLNGGVYRDSNFGDALEVRDVSYDEFFQTFDAFSQRQKQYRFWFLYLMVDTNLGDLLYAASKTGEWCWYAMSLILSGPMYTVYGNTNYRKVVTKFIQTLSTMPPHAWKLLTEASCFITSIREVEMSGCFLDERLEMLNKILKEACKIATAEAMRDESCIQAVTHVPLLEFEGWMCISMKPESTQTPSRRKQTLKNVCKIVHMLTFDKKHKNGLSPIVIAEHLAKPKTEVTEPFNLFTKEPIPEAVYADSTENFVRAGAKGFEVYVHNNVVDPLHPKKIPKGGFGGNKIVADPNDKKSKSASEDKVVGVCVTVPLETVLHRIQRVVEVETSNACVCIITTIIILLLIENQGVTDPIQRARIINDLMAEFKSYQASAYPMMNCFLSEKSKRVEPRLDKAKSLFRTSIYELTGKDKDDLWKTKPDELKTVSHVGGVIDFGGELYNSSRYANGRTVQEFFEEYCLHRLDSLLREHSRCLIIAGDDHWQDGICSVLKASKRHERDTRAAADRENGDDNDEDVLDLSTTYIDSLTSILLNRKRKCRLISLMFEHILNHKDKILEAHSDSTLILINHGFGNSFDQRRYAIRLTKGHPPTQWNQCHVDEADEASFWGIRHASKEFAISNWCIVYDDVDLEVQALYQLSMFHELRFFRRSFDGTWYNLTELMYAIITAVLGMDVFIDERSERPDQRDLVHQIMLEIMVLFINFGNDYQCTFLGIGRKTVMNFYIKLRGLLNERYGHLAMLICGDDEEYDGHESIQINYPWLCAFLAFISICSGKVDKIETAEERLFELDGNARMLYEEAREKVTSDPLHKLESVLPSLTSLEHHTFRTWVIANLYAYATRDGMEMPHPKILSFQSWQKGWVWLAQERRLKFKWEDEEVINALVKLVKSTVDYKCKCKTSKCTKCTCARKHVGCKTLQCGCDLTKCENPHNEIGGVCADPACPRRPLVPENVAPDREEIREACNRGFIADHENLSDDSGEDEEYSGSDASNSDQESEDSEHPFDWKAGNQVLDKEGEQMDVN